MKSNEGGNAKKRSALMEKRVTTMADGRYLIYFTFPAIDSEFDKLHQEEVEGAHSRQRGEEKH